jgi:hypothetical protein
MTNIQLTYPQLFLIIGAAVTTAFIFALLTAPIFMVDRAF